MNERSRFKGFIQWTDIGYGRFIFYNSRYIDQMRYTGNDAISYYGRYKRTRAMFMHQISRYGNVLKGNTNPFNASTIER